MSLSCIENVSRHRAICTYMHPTLFFAFGSFFPSGTFLSNQAASHHLLELCHVHPSSLQDEEVEPVFLPLLLFSFVGDGGYVSCVAF